MLFEITTISNREEHFFKSGDRNTIASYSQRVDLLIKLVEEVLKFVADLHWDLKSDFSRNFRQHVHIISEILLQVRLNTVIRVLASLL